MQRYKVVQSGYIYPVNLSIASTGTNDSKEVVIDVGASFRVGAIMAAVYMSSGYILPTVAVRDRLLLTITNNGTDTKLTYNPLDVWLLTSGQLDQWLARHPIVFEAGQKYTFALAHVATTGTTFTAPMSVQITLIGDKIQEAG